MNTETEHLKRIADEIAARKTHDNPAAAEADYHLATEAKRLEKEITHSLTTIENFTQRDTFHFNTLSKLVNICDQLYDTTKSVNPNVLVLIDLLTNIKRVLPNELRPSLKLPKAFIELQCAGFAQSWSRHSALMLSHQVPEQLIAIAGIPFRRFTQPKGNLLWGDYTWLKGYQAKLDILDWENADCSSPAEALMSLLIGRDFNDDRFYIYCKKYIGARMAEVKGKHNRVLELAGCEKLVLEDTQLGMPCFDAHANSVSTRLIKLIREEIDFVETHEREQLQEKFAFKWSAEMIACFFKLLHERKVFGNMTLERLSIAVAANCSSVDKAEFQASTIHSRFYKKDIELLKALAKLLRDMLGGIGDLPE